MSTSGSICYWYIYRVHCLSKTPPASEHLGVEELKLTESAGYSIHLKKSITWSEF